MNDLETALWYSENIRNSGISIYDPINVGDPRLWIPSAELEILLNHKISGLDLSNLALRTRSKVLKEAVCKAIGYPIPTSFKKVKPRFPGQNFDTYGQQSDNFQVWNEELSPTRRYVIVRILLNGTIGRIRVVAGDTLSLLDTTGTLTQKYQARLITTNEDTELISLQDTNNIIPSLAPYNTFNIKDYSPTAIPSNHQLLPIAEIYTRLSNLVGTSFENRGITQERNRGADIHRLVCKALGYCNYADNGQFPDIRHQLLEVKLQTSPTIDLGLACPDGHDKLDIPILSGTSILHRDVRYVIFQASINGEIVRIDRIYVTTGADFFNRFRRFEGNVLNKKIQMKLPITFFD